MKGVTSLFLYTTVFLVVQTVAQTGKESVGKLAESQEVPSSQRIATDVIDVAIEDLKKKAEAVKAGLEQGCTFGYCGRVGCCEGYFCDIDSFCRQDCEGRSCLIHPDECCENYFCNAGRCERFCSTTSCAHGDGLPCCHGYYCDGYMCQECSTSYCGHGEVCCDGYYCDEYTGMCRSST